MLKREHNNDSNSTPYMIGLAEPDRPFRLRDYNLLFNYYGPSSAGDQETKKTSFSDERE